MLRFCASCGSPVAEAALACTSCGAPARQSVRSGVPAARATATAGLTESLVGALAYVTFLPAIFFLLLDPYNKNRFVRFHSFQSIFLSVFWFILSFVVTLLGSVVGLAMLLFLPLALAGLGLWIILIFKAYQGNIFKLPIIGDFAEKEANNA